MLDRDIVLAMAAGDRRGLGEAYEAYADQLHDYAGSLLGPTHAALDQVTRDAFLVAFAEAERLEDPERLRAWLYALVRDECRRRHSDASPASPEVAGSGDPELDELVGTAVARLRPREREVFDLGLRHGLPPEEIAAVVGRSPNAVRSTLARLRVRLAPVGPVVVARRSPCPELAAVLATWHGMLDPAWRRKVSEHTAGCEACGQVRERGLGPDTFLSVLPLVGTRAPMNAADADLLLDAAGALDRAGALGDGGFPRLTAAPVPGSIEERAHPRRRVAVLAGAAVVLLVLGASAVTRLIAPEVGDERSSPTPPHAGPTLAFVREPEATLEPARQKQRSSATAPLPSSSPLLLQTGVSGRVAPQPTTEPSRRAPAPLAPPQPAPGRPPKPGPTTSPPSSDPPPKPSPRPSPRPAAPGTLSVSPAGLTVPATGTGSITLTAVGGPVTWTAGVEGGAPAGVTLSATAGTTAAGKSEAVVVVLTDVHQRVRSFDVVIGPGDHVVRVTVDHKKKKK